MHRGELRSWSGRSTSLAELAQAEKIDKSYLCRVLRLTLLAPDIVEASLDVRQPEQVTLPALMKPFPVEWDDQAEALWPVADPDRRAARPPPSAEDL